MKYRNYVILFLCLALLLGTGTSCGKKGAAEPENTANAVEPVYALVVKDTGNPYMRTMFNGFETACKEVGAQAVLVGPDENSNQADIIKELIEQDVDAIVIAANDADEVSAALQEAIQAGIPVVSLDSQVNPEDRIVHIQQASPEVVGRVLIQAAYEMLGGEGQIAVLSTTDSMPNQTSWVNWMETELRENPEKYAGMELACIVYGQDNSEISAETVRTLLSDYPNLSLIIAPTTVGLCAAAEVVAQETRSVKVTGLGLPSEMEPYITSGICPWMYLWNPSNLGYLAAYAADALKDGSFTGAVDEILSAGTLGERIVTGSEDGGTEIVLGSPMMIFSSNIAVWKEIF